MEIKGLRFFLGVLRYKSITKAADHLYIAQPALGLQIRKLEEELGAQLFQRHSRGVTPTEAGLLLAEHAELILRQLDRAHQDLTDYGETPRGRVTIGLSPTTSQLLATTVAARVKEAYPKISLNITEGLSEQLMEWVEKERVDIALTYNPGSTGDVVVERLASEALHYVRLYGEGADNSPVRMTDILDGPLVLPSRPHLLRVVVDDAAKAMGREVQIACEVDSVPTIRAFVRAGFGGTVLPLGAVRRAVEEKSLEAVPLIEPEIERTLHIAYSPARPSSKAFLSVSQILRAVIDDIIASPAAGWRRVE